MANNNGQNNKQDNKTVDSVNNSRDISDSQVDINRSNASNGRVYNIQNLKPYNKTDRVLSSQEAKRRGSIGGKKSGEARRQKKTMRETIINMISQEVDPDKLASMGVDIDSLGGDYTYQAAIIAAMLREAVNGDTKAMALLRDTMGEMPTVKTENRTEVITQDDLKTISNLKNYLTG